MEHSLYKYLGSEKEKCFHDLPELGAIDLIQSLLPPAKGEGDGREEGEEERGGEKERKGWGGVTYLT
jgi:hypothetical protein